MQAASPGEAADLLVGEGEPGGPQGPEGAADRGQEEALVPDVQGAPLGQVSHLWRISYVTRVYVQTDV